MYLGGHPHAAVVADELAGEGQIDEGNVIEVFQATDVIEMQMRREYQNRLVRQMRNRVANILAGAAARVEQQGALTSDDQIRDVALPVPRLMDSVVTVVKPFDGKALPVES